MPNTQLYDEGAVRWFLQHLMPAGELNLPDKSLLVSLTASPRMMPHSSLIHMIAAIGAKLGAEVEYLSERSMAEIVEIVRHAAKPILLFMTALALSDLLEHLADTKTDLPLPAGSRIMETGGYKGQRKRLGGEELYALASRKLGIPSRSIVNEYGMTEMSSQFYDRTLFSPELDEAEARIKHPAPWVRSLVLDPRTRKAAGEGEIGVLQHIDLANLDSCAFLLTADAARKRGTGFELIGRLDKLPLRGCSVGYEETRA
ncbi:hypothetical protein HY256_10740 [Candidatus Sumerlaeota bacterium]|nr:hypothetical protein [Candidatus Sumerlaeota bacterium]